MKHKSPRLQLETCSSKDKAVFLELDCEYFEFLLLATIASAASYLFRNSNIRKSDVIWQVIPFPQIMT